jgi:Right handed beta helix region
VTLRNNTFADNTAFDRGGAAYLDAASPVDITGNDFTDNTSVESGSSGESGGGIYVIADGEFTLVDNTFSRNTATARGGGATARLCSGATVTGNTFDANKIVQSPENTVLLTRELSDGPRGAGLHLARLACQIVGKGDGEFQVLQSGNDFTANLIEKRDDERPPGGGGGESIQDLTVQSTDDSFLGNKIHNPRAEGGGLSVETSGGQVFEGRNLVAAANVIDGEGGEGGGVYIGADRFAGELRLFDSTVVSNQAENGSGIHGGPCDALILHNGIVYGNTGDTNGEISGFNAAQQCVEQVPGGAARAAGDPGTRDVRFTDFCETGVQSAAGDGNACIDPLSTPAPATCTRSRPARRATPAATRSCRATWPRTTRAMGASSTRASTWAPTSSACRRPSRPRRRQPPRPAASGRGPRRSAALLRVEARLPHPPARAAGQDGGVGHRARQRQAGQGGSRAPAQGPRGPARPAQGEVHGPDHHPAQGRQAGRGHPRLQHVHPAALGRRPPARLSVASF